MNKRLLTILTSFILVIGVWISVGHPVEDLKTLNYYTVQQVLNRVSGTAGSAIPSGLIQIGGSDGTNSRELKVNSSGEISVNNSTSITTTPSNTSSTPLYVSTTASASRSYPHPVTLCQTGIFKSGAMLLSGANIFRAAATGFSLANEWPQSVVITDDNKTIYSTGLGPYEQSHPYGFPQPISTITNVTATFANNTHKGVCVRLYTVSQ